MPDDIKVVAGVGDDTVAPPVATDLIASKHYQKIKAGWGADGTWVETADADGARTPVGGAQIGATNEAAPAADTGTASGLNGRLQRIAQRLTSVYNFMLTEAYYQSNTGQTTDLAATSDTANATIHGRLQRVAQNITTLIGRLPTTLGQKTAANSLAVTLASDQPALGISDPVQIPASAIDGSTSTAGNNQQVMPATAGLRLLGFTVRETTTSAPALVYLRHGTTNAGVALAIASLGPGESVREWYGPDGIVASSGIFAERSLGATHFTTFYKVVP